MACAFEKFLPTLIRKSRTDSDDGTADKAIKKKKNEDYATRRRQITTLRNARTCKCVRKIRDSLRGVKTERNWNDDSRQRHHMLPYVRWLHRWRGAREVASSGTSENPTGSVWRFFSAATELARRARYSNAITRRL